MEPNNSKYDTHVLDRHQKNVIYSTIQSINKAAKEERKMAYMLANVIEWEEFKQYVPLQVVGLLLF